MKIFTQKSAKKFSPEFGPIKQIKYFIFGFHYWTVYNPIEIPDNLEETALCQIIAERQVSYSEMTANLPELSNLHFDNFQNHMVKEFKTH